MAHSTLSRRAFLQTLVSCGLLASPARALAQAQCQTPPYQGPLLMTLAADGAWDVTSFCDPKADSQMNHWAGAGGQIQTLMHSPIRYAPFAENSHFFQRHHQQMLIFNGVDSQTNAHNAGVRHLWSGRFNPGFPSPGALVAACHGPSLPLAYLSNGGYRYTADLLPAIQLQQPEALRALAAPNRAPEWAGQHFLLPSQHSLQQQYQQQRLARLQTQSSNARLDRQLAYYQAALESAPELKALLNCLPEHLPSAQWSDGSYHPLPRQISLGLTAMAAGLTVSVDLYQSGFDTHSNHDSEHSLALAKLTSSVDLIWQQAEQLGIAERLVLLMGSDFSRTPHYNDGDGKDHWPFGSALVMSRRPGFGNQVLGVTDDQHWPTGLNTSLQPDGPVRLQPKHIQQFIRQLLAVDQHSLSQRFDLQANELDLRSLF